MRYYKMPKKPIDYSKTIIYKIVCNDLNIKDVYVGHTTEFTKRKCKHKYCCLNKNNSKYNYKVYQIIREHGGWNNWEMIEIEKYPCVDENEAKARENYYYDLLNSKLNTITPLMREATRAEYLKNYFTKNKETIYNRNKTQQTCECGSICRNDNIYKHYKTIKHQNYLKSLELTGKPQIGI